MPVRDDSQLSEFYIRQMRALQRAGRTKAIRWRPAINRDEKLLAQEVRGLVEKITSGYQGGEIHPDANTCIKCGGIISVHNRVYKKIWYNDGSVVEFRRCTTCGG